MLRLVLICLTFSVVCSFDARVCKEAEDCIKLRNYFYAPNDKIDIRFTGDFDFIDDSIMKTFCLLVAVETRCYEKADLNCSNAFLLYRAIVRDNYLCSDIGRAAIRNMSRSPCVKDRKQQQDVYTSFDACHSKLSVELASLALKKDVLKDKTSREKPVIEKWRTCQIKEATQKCGPEYGYFTESIVTNDEIGFHILAALDYESRHRTSLDVWDI